MVGNWMGLDSAMHLRLVITTTAGGIMGVGILMVTWSCERIREAWQLGVIELGSASHLRHIIRTPRPGRLSGGGPPPMASRLAGQNDDVFIDVWQSSVFDKFDLPCV